MNELEGIRHRNPTLLLALLGYLDEADEAIPWNELVELHTAGTRWKTVENAVYDLAKFGALARLGKPGRRGTADTRALRITPLGRAWLAQTVLPLPGADRDDELEEAPVELVDEDHLETFYEVPDDLIGDVTTNLGAPSDDVEVPEI